MARRGYGWRAATLTAVLATLLAATGGGCGKAGRAVPALTAVMAPQDAARNRIGVLSVADGRDRIGARSCTASVVDSPHRDLLVTRRTASTSPAAGRSRA